MNANASSFEDANVPHETANGELPNVAEWGADDLEAFIELATTDRFELYARSSIPRAAALSRRLICSERSDLRILGGITTMYFAVQLPEEASSLFEELLALDAYAAGEAAASIEARIRELKPQTDDEWITFGRLVRYFQDSLSLAL
jgi:hypothetical protein